MSAEGLEGAQKPPQAQGVSARRIGLFCFVAVAELVQGIDHSARFSERPFAVRQGPVTAFHRFEVVAREDVRGRFQRHPISLRQFEIFFWGHQHLERVCTMVLSVARWRGDSSGSRFQERSVFPVLIQTRLSPATSAAGSL
jgi:hypothetical protein